MSRFFESRKKKKSNIIAKKDTEISKKMKDKSWLSIEKNFVQ